MDIVYILGSGSFWGNNEIRYSLRSVEKHMQDIGDLTIIGDKPKFLNCGYIPMGDYKGPEKKEFSIANKILVASQVLKTPFLMVHDDHFITKNFYGYNYPYYYDGRISDINNNKGHYGKTIANSIRELGYVKNFDVHCPMLIDDYFDNLFEYPWPDFGYLVKSYYVYRNDKQNILPIKDVKVRKPMNITEWRQLAEDRPFFSIADQAINSTFLKFMNELYPKKSRWEK